MRDLIIYLLDRLCGVRPIRGSTVSQFLNADRRHHGAL
jgi:hypothetical protein